MNTYDSKNLQSCLTYLWVTYGTELFDNPRRLSSFIADIAPTLKKERKITVKVAQLGIFETFYSLDSKNQDEQNRIILDSISTLIEEEFIDKAIAEHYIRLLASVFSKSNHISHQSEKASHPEKKVVLSESPPVMKVDISVDLYKELGIDRSWSTEKIVGYLRGLQKVWIRCQYNCNDVNELLRIDAILNNIENAFRQLCNEPRRKAYDIALEQAYQSGASSPSDVSNKKYPTPEKWRQMHRITQSQSSAKPQPVKYLKDKTIFFTSLHNPFFYPTRNINFKISSEYTILEALEKDQIVQSQSQYVKDRMDTFLSLARKSVSSVQFPDNFVRIGSSAFKNYVNLTTVKMPRYLETIGSEAFAGCSSLRKIYIPSNVSTLHRATFADCSELEEVILPKTLTSIEGAVFANCSSLRTLILPPHLQSLQDGCFSGCTSLKSVWIPASLKHFSTNVLRSSGIEKVYLEQGIESIKGELHSMRQLDIWIPDSVKVIQLASYPQKLIVHSCSPTIIRRLPSNKVKWVQI